MDLIADILLLFAAFGAGLYCRVLSRRLTKFTDLEQGVGGAVAVLSVQVDDLKKALEDARKTAAEASAKLEATTQRAEDTARQLELTMASAHGDGGNVSGRSDAPRSLRRRRRQSSGVAQEDAA